MKQYQLNIYQPVGAPPPPEILGKIMNDVHAFIEDTKTSRVWVFNGALSAPSSATVVRFKDGEATFTDGPFAEGKEFIGGFVVIRVADLDAALHWGTKLSHATMLPIEVRPFQ